MKDNNIFKGNIYDDDDINIIKYFKILYRKKKSFLITVFSATLFSGILLNNTKPVWIGGFEFIINDELEKNAPNNRLDFVSILKDGKKSNSINNQLNIIKSPLVLLPIFRKTKNNDLTLNTKFKNTNEYKEYISWLKKININLIKGSNIVEVKHKNNDKNNLRKTLNELTKVSISFNK